MALATLIAFTAPDVVALAQTPPPPPVPGPAQPFKDSIKRREKIMKNRPKIGDAAKRAMDRKALRNQPMRPPPPPAPTSPAAGGAKAEEDKSRPIKENHLRPWPRWRRGRIDFDKADIRDVAKFISEITG